MGSSQPQEVVKTAPELEELCKCKNTAEKEKGGTITKAGNSRCRTQLVEFVIHYIKRPIISAKMKRRFGARKEKLEIALLKSIYFTQV